MKQIWLTGDAVVDLIPNGDDQYLKCPGGAPANVAVAISRLGGKCSFFGRVGQDPLGRFMRQTLHHEGVNIEQLALDEEHRTSTVIVDLDEHGERSFTFMVKPSADQFLDKTDVPAFTQGEWMHVCSIALANNPSRESTFFAIEKMKQAGGYISFDPNLREEVWGNQDEIIPTVMKAVALADVVKFSEEELTFLTSTQDLQSALSAISTLSIPLVVVTLGAKGSLVVFKQEQRVIASREVKPVDTTGAGDAFVGGLLARLSELADWQSWDNVCDAVIWGNCCGGLATTEKGAMTALPSREALLSLIS